MATATFIAIDEWEYLVLRLTPWLNVVCLVILFTAAILHWQRTRHWCLLTMASGSLLAALAAIAIQIAQLQVLPEVTLASGAVKFNRSLLTILTWLVACCVVVVAVGGIGAVHWAIRLRRESKRSQEEDAIGLH